ncbi:hypothetical protein FBQ97_15475, partial [Acidobacteria bacterium ACD]|nr:hypothetical protein [Acidobacteria bacterium ACD]
VALSSISAANVDRIEVVRGPFSALWGSEAVGGVTSLFLRGTGSAQTLVLLDGAKLNSPYFGAVDLSSISAANVDRIEVVRGPFSALWGSEAVGGVVRSAAPSRPSGAPRRSGAS